jgi:hypothetical protein
MLMTPKPRTAKSTRPIIPRDNKGNFLFIINGQQIWARNLIRARHRIPINVHV